jgi:hypothetical protein
MQEASAMGLVDGQFKMENMFRVFFIKSPNPKYEVLVQRFNDSTLLIVAGSYMTIKFLGWVKLAFTCSKSNSTLRLDNVLLMSNENKNLISMVRLSDTYGWRLNQGSKDACIYVLSTNNVISHCTRIGDMFALDCSVVSGSPHALLAATTLSKNERNESIIVTDNPKEVLTHIRNEMENWHKKRITHFENMP